MNWTTTRRLGAVAAVAALTSVAAPAYAQPDPVTIDVFLADAAVPAGGSNDRVDFTIQANRAAEVENLTLTFDTSGLAGVATIDVPDSDCTASGTEVVCTELFPTDLTVDPVSLFDVAIAAEPGAVAGDTGTVVLTAAATGAEPGSHTAAVTIGAPVDLVASDNASLTASVGETLPLPWTVRNAGTEPAAGVALLISSHIGVSQRQYSNCVYYPNFFISDQPGSGLCRFDVVLEPGTTYTFVDPPTVEVDADARAPGFYLISGQWMTRTDGEIFAAWEESRGRTGEPGTGPALDLVQVGGGSPPPVTGDPVPAADVDPLNNTTSVDLAVHGENEADFAAVGDRLAGEAGDLVTAEVGVANLGPAIASNQGSAEPVNLVRVVVPEGTTATDVPDACHPVDDSGSSTGDPGVPGGSQYHCFAGFLLPVGEQEIFPFVFRIDEVIPDATGVVRVNESIGQPVLPDDNPDNDEAVIVVNASDGGGGGTLPVTGATTWMIAAAGGLLLALGAASVVLVRHRRTRFVA